MLGGVLWILVSKARIMPRCKHQDRKSFVDTCQHVPTTASTVDDINPALPIIRNIP